MQRIQQGLGRGASVAENSTGKESHDEGAKLDSTGEFFSVGAPLHAVRAGYVRRRADDLLYETVITGRYAHVLAPDRSGKSSLIAATAARLENHGCRVAILDLEQIGVRDGGTDPGRWYYSVAYRLLRQLRIRYDLQNWWQDKSMLSNQQRLLEFYSEIILQHVPERIVIFVDEIQCIEDLPYADQLLTSIRAAHNARTTDPEFTRLAFVLLGECDPVSLMAEAELSPFNVTQQVLLSDFSRNDLELFATELNLTPIDAEKALDRIYYWTRGHPYLSQKFARAIAKEEPNGDIDAYVDRVATQQLAGRAALHNEPHMSHIHRQLANDRKRCEPLLNLYGKVRKGIKVAADLGSPQQRRLMAVGLLEIDADSNLKVRNRLYEAVFTTRWANENLPTHFRIPAIVAGVMLLFAMIPFWYTQSLPKPYVRVLTSNTIALSVASVAYENLRSFPGHADTADNLYRAFLDRRASATVEESEIRQLAKLAAVLPNSERFPQELEASFWDRKACLAMRGEDRDAALLATLQSLVLSTQQRRQRAAILVGDDYPLLLATLPALPSGTTVFDPVGMVLTTAVGAEISQWSYTPQGLKQREPWSVTALEVNPLVRRVIVDREGIANRIGLVLNVSHARLADLRIKIIAPSGRAVEIETGLERASSNDDIRIPARQLEELKGEPLRGTWSISVRDESLGVAGQLVGWNLTLNSQGVVEHFQRGLNIPDPVERETENIWFDPMGRYAIARATQSDSARIWDLAFAEPLRAIAVSENETLIGLKANARRLVTASQDRVNLWDTASGDRVASIAVGAASTTAVMTPDGTHLFVERRSDAKTSLELWSLDDGEITAEVVIAGVPAHVAIDASGTRVAVADYDRAIRVWDFATAELIGQFDLPLQPSDISFSANGTTLGVTYGDAGVSLWNIARPQEPLLEEFGTGDWQLVFSPSGSVVAVGRPDIGFQTYSSDDGRVLGPALGVRSDRQADDMLAFSDDEQIVLTGNAAGSLRFWRAPGVSAHANGTAERRAHSIWSPSADRPLVATPDGSIVAIGDPHGHVHMIPSNAAPDDLAVLGDDVSFVGHISEVRLLGVSPDGTHIASAAIDNSVRVWDSSTGQPKAYQLDIQGAAISQLVFSPQATVLAILNGTDVVLLAVDDGTTIAEFELGDVHNGITFAAEHSLYIGGENGVLQLISQVAEDNWQMQHVWQGGSPIRFLQASPRGDFLILVDQDNVASQFSLSEGRIGNGTLHLPGAVQEVVYDSSGVRVFFRTSRWIHRASSSVSGLIWIDTLFGPRPIGSAGLVLGNGSGQPSIVSRIYLPAARNGYIELVELNFAGASTPGLFGNKDELLSEWRNRISAGHREGS